MRAPPIIPDRGEFIDALRLLLKGHVLVNLGGLSDAYVLNGHSLYSVQRTLIDYGLVQAFRQPRRLSQRALLPAQRTGP